MEHRADDFDWALLDRYAAGEATAEEAARVERWMTTDPARRALVEALRRPAAAADEWDVAAAWSSVRSRALADDTRDDIRARVAQAMPADAHAARRWSPAPALLRAAAIVAVIGATVVATRALLQRDGAASVEVIARTTARSESDTVRLDDGSIVILAAQSRLEYPRTFAATSRAVRLAGEALFRVTPDPSRAFTVSAGQAVIRVVGTEFVTRTHRGAAAAVDDVAGVTVAVAEGVVAVRVTSPSGEDVVVRRGEVAEVSADGRTRVSAVADLDRYLGWIEGRLVFDDVPLTDVLAELRRWYPLEFRAEGTLADRRVTARLRAGALAETVDALAVALGAAHVRTGDTITFTLTPTPR